MIRKTSKEAYERILDQLSERRAEVYRVLYEHGPLTANEIFKYIQKHEDQTNKTTARLAELRAFGLAKEVGTRECTITGFNVILWDAVDTLPKKLKKHKPKVCNVKDAIKYADSYLAHESRSVPRKAIRVLATAAKLYLKYKKKVKQNGK